MSKFSELNIRSGRRKLTPEQVYEMRVKYAAGATQGELSREYKVTVGQVGRIVRGEGWQAFYNPAESVTGTVPPILAKSDEQIKADAEASLKTVLERMEADIAKARERPLDKFLEPDPRAKKYTGE
jgi:hypothetical protein